MRSNLATEQLGITPTRFPYSDTAGETDRSSYPAHFAAMCVLHRCARPRHPLSALCFDFRPFSSDVKEQTISNKEKQRNKGSLLLFLANYFC